MDLKPAAVVNIKNTEGVWLTLMQSDWVFHSVTIEAAWAFQRVKHNLPVCVLDPEMQNTAAQWH